MWNKKKFKLHALKKMEEATPRVEAYEKIEVAEKKPKMNPKKKWGLIGGGLSFAAVLAVTISLVTIKPWEQKDEYASARQEANYCYRLAYNQVAILEDSIPLLDSAPDVEGAANTTELEYESFSIADAYRFNMTFSDYPVNDFPKEAIGKSVDVLLALMTFNGAKKWYEGTVQTIIMVIHIGDYVTGLLGCEWASPSLWSKENGYLLGKIPSTIERSFGMVSDMAIGKTKIVDTVNIFQSPFSEIFFDIQNGVFSFYGKRYFKEFSPDADFEASVDSVNHIESFSTFDIRTDNGQGIANAKTTGEPEMSTDEYGNVTYSVGVDCPQFPDINSIHYKRSLSYSDICSGKETEVAPKAGGLISFAYNISASDYYTSSSSWWFDSAILIDTIFVK